MKHPIIAAKFYKKKIIRKLTRMFSINGGAECIFPDKLYIQKKYQMFYHEKLDLKHPRTFSEKLNWLKLYNRQPQYTKMVDKYLVKGYVSRKIGSEIVVPLITTWDKPDEIDFSKLPSSYVIKCNHISNVLICKNGEFFGKHGERVAQDQVIKQLKNQLKMNYFKIAREWPYKNVRKKIICEKYIERKPGEISVDFKCYCFNGKVKLIQRLEEILRSESDVTCDYFDRNWELVKIKNPFRPQLFEQVEKPIVLDDMIKYAEILSENIPFVRVDFMVWGNRLYFGEMTFFDWAGFIKFEPDKWNYILGDWIPLPKKRHRINILRK